MQAELQEIEQAKENYQTVLRQTIEDGYYPFNSQIEQQLKELQTGLKLIDSEVGEISRPILKQAEADYQIQIRTQKFTFEVIVVDERGRENNKTTKEAELFREDLGDDVSLEMVKIPSGTFLMGTEDSEIARLCQKYGVEWFKREQFQHQVTVKSFYMGQYPITQAQWRVVAKMDKVFLWDLESNPSHFKGHDLPVERVSWYNSMEFCARLSRATGKNYRLPSEAEWEYACRAGTNTPFHFGASITTNLANYRGTDDKYQDKVYPGNYANEPKGKYLEKTTAIKSFPPNAFGLYDMHGNVWEWCEDDWYSNYINAPGDGTAWPSRMSTNEKVIRGGSWNYFPHYCRSAFRGYVTRDNRSYRVGFRVVCVIHDTT